MRRRGEKQRVRDWRQRSALPACRHIRDTEVADGVEAGALGDDRRLADLQRRMRRLVPDGLPMRAHGANIRRLQSGFRDHVLRGLGEPGAEIEVHPAEVAGLRFAHDRAQLAALVIVVRMLHIRQQLDAVARAV